MTITKTDLESQRELIQNDIDCYLDGLPNEVINEVFNIVCERFQILLDKLDNHD